MLPLNARQFPRLLFRPEPLVSHADCILRERLPGLQPANVFGDVLPLVQKLCVCLNEPDQLLAVHPQLGSVCCVYRAISAMM
jgi:hypothetical protein